MYPINLRYIFGKRITQYDLVVKIVNRKFLIPSQLGVNSVKYFSKCIGIYVLKGSEIGYDDKLLR